MIPFFLFCIGLALGSFVNTLVWRIHVHMMAEERVASRKKPKPVLAGKPDKYSILTGRSMCPHCEHELAAKDLVPVVSWAWLRGKCRYCRKPIGWQYPLVELSVAGLFVVSYLVWPLALEGYGLVAFGFWLVFLTGFMALAVYDTRWFLLPDRIVFPLIGLALVQVGLRIFVFDGGTATLIEAVWGVAIASGLFGLIYLVARAVGQEWIGLGDVKLGVVLGLLAGGPWGGLLVIFIASLLGTIAVLPALLTKRAGRATLIPYGPFLLAATVVVVLAGGRLIGWLERMLIV